MKTRNEFIAETAREFDVHGRRAERDTVIGYDDPDEAILAAKHFAEDLEAAGVAPWAQEAESSDPTANALLDSALAYTMAPTADRLHALKVAAIEYSKGKA